MSSQYDYVKKPWGGYQDFSRQRYDVIKELRVNSGESLSLQSHKKREEHWIVISGRGMVQIEESTTKIKRGDYLGIGRGKKHRLINHGRAELRVLELQLGVCSEEDITRYDDLYGRESS